MKFMLTTAARGEAKMPIAPSRLPAPAVSWLVDSSPFSVQQQDDVGPDSALGVLGALCLLVLSRLVFASAIKSRRIFSSR